MISVADIARLNPALPGKRHFVMLWFYCDESYDSNPKGKGAEKKGPPPKTYSVAGFLASERGWPKIEKPWAAKNRRIGVSRFHAACVNARDGEFQGWGKNRRDRYAKYMLALLKKQGKKLHGFSCGMLADEYRRIISPAGQERLGHPYLACFKTCIALIATKMRPYGKEHKFSVILDRNEFENDAVKMFYAMKDYESWPERYRLGTCAPGSWEEFVALQPADLIAYETFRLLSARRNNVEAVRRSLKSMIGKVGLTTRYFDVALLERIKPTVEDSDATPGAFIVFPNMEDDVVEND